MTRRLFRRSSHATVVVSLGLLAALGASAYAGADTGAGGPTRAEAAACSPRTSVLKSPRRGSHEVQAKALNDRGDVVGFADGRDGTDRAILWRGGKVRRALNLGVLPGYVSSEAYGVNNHRVVFGLLYDRKERTYPFRWKDGHMTVLKGPNGRLRQADAPDRNAINERGEIAGTLLIGGQRRAVRWTRRGKASFLPPLPGHTWTNAWSIGNDGVVSGWSRKLPNDDGENNPVIWTKSGKVIALKTPPGRADGAAEATNSSGLTVGYLGNLGTDTDPESDQAAVWQTRTAEPQLIGPAGSLRLRGAGRRQRPRTGRRHVRHVHQEPLPSRPTRDLANRLGRAYAPSGFPPISKPPGRLHTAQRHQRPRIDRRRRVRPLGPGLRRAPARLPHPLEVPVRTVTAEDRLEAGGGNRTHTKSLEGSCATTTPRPRGTSMIQS